MTYENYIPEALAWNLSDDEMLKCIHEQAELMLGLDDYFGCSAYNYPHHHKRIESGSGRSHPKSGATPSAGRRIDAVTDFIYVLPHLSL